MPLGRCDVGTPLQHDRRQGDRGRRRLGRPVGGRFDGQVRWRDADQHGDGVLGRRPLLVHIRQARLSADQLGLGLQDVALGGDADLVLVLSDLQRLGVGFDRGLEQPLVGVGQTQLDIVGRQLALGRQPRIGQVRFRCLRGAFGAFHGAADLAPQVDLPAASQRRLIAVGGLRRAGAMRAHGRTRQIQAREQGGAILGHQGAGLAVGGLGGLEVLVGDLDLGFERIELVVAEHRPPVAAVHPVGGNGWRPALGLLKGGRRRHGRALIVRADGAGRDQQQGKQAEGAKRGRADHGSHSWNMMD